MFCPSGITQVALFAASREHAISKSTPPLAWMVLPLVQAHDCIGLMSRRPVLTSVLLSPTKLMRYATPPQSRVPRPTSERRMLCGLDVKHDT